MADDDDRDPMDAEGWFDQPNICGSCIAWKVQEPEDGEEVAAGICKLRPELRRVPATMRKCDIYKPRGRFKYDASSVQRGSPKRRRNKVLKVVRIAEDGTETHIRRPRKPAKDPFRRSAEPDYEATPRRTYKEPTVSAGELSTERRPDVVERPARPPAPSTIHLGDTESVPVVKQALVFMIREELGRSRREMHTKFARGGKVLVATPQGETKSMPAERFFSMLDRLQSSLGELEKAIDGKSESLGDKVKKELSGQVRRMRGSMTTFNVMFQHKEDQFRSK